MRKFTLLGWLALFIAITMSCLFTSAETKIRPGDRIGDMEFFTNEDELQVLNLNEICSFDELFKGTCLIPTSLSGFCISSGWTEGSQAELELDMKDSEWSMTFDDHEIDLRAFGSHEFVSNTQLTRFWDVPDKMEKEIHKSSQVMQMWDVCVSNPGIGKHTIQYEFLLKNGVWRGYHIETYTFSVRAVAMP